jgi:tetratricopeptide (TPR) repeat protein
MTSRPTIAIRNAGIAILAAGILLPSALSAATPDQPGQLIVAQADISQTLIADGDKAWQAGNPTQAADLYSRAVETGNLTSAQRAYALRALGFVSAEIGNPDEAARAFKASLSIEDNPGAALGLAVSLRQSGDIAGANAALAKVDRRVLTTDQLPFYLDEKASAALPENPQAAIAALEEAVSLNESVYRRVRLSQLYRQTGDTAKAQANLEMAEAALAAQPGAAADVAYAALTSGDDAAAARYFEQARAGGGLTSNGLADYGYALKRQGDLDGSTELFRDAIDTHDTSPDAQDASGKRRLFRLRREVSYTERTWYADAFLSFRDNSVDLVSAPEAGESDSFAGWEVGYIAPQIGSMKHRALTLFTRGFTGFEGDTLNTREESLQLGVGARFRPLADHNLVFTVERLISVGDQARDAWLLVAGYSLADGLDIDPVLNSWESWNVYADVAYIPDDPRFVATNLEGWYGHSFKLSESVVLTPHVVAAARYSDDKFDTNRVVEAGPGVGLRYWFNEDKYTGPRSYFDFKAQYRYAFVNEDDRDDGAFVGTAILHY